MRHELCANDFIIFPGLYSLLQFFYCIGSLVNNAVIILAKIICFAWTNIHRVKMAERLYKFSVVRHHSTPGIPQQMYVTE